MIFNILPLIAFVLCVKESSGKYVSGVFQLDAGDFISGPEYEITKFFFSQGVAHISGEFQYLQRDANWHTFPALFLFNDKDFQGYHDAVTCEDKVELAKAVIPIGQDGAGRGGGRRNRFLGGDSSARGQIKESNVELETDAKTGEEYAVWSFHWELNQRERTHGWFLIAADCALEQYGTKVAPMKYNIILLNDGMDQLTANEYGMQTVYFLMLILMTVFGVYVVALARKHAADTSGKIHLIVKIFLICFLFQYVSIMFEFIHLWYYRSNGYGVHFLDLFSELLEAFSTLLISFVLICLACGWTLVDTTADAKKGSSVASILGNPKSLLDGHKVVSNLLVIGMIFIVAFTTILVVLNKSKEDDFTKFHDHESGPGKILVTFRLVLGILYIFCFRATVAAQAAKGIGGGNLGTFLKKLMLFGAIWFLSFPALVFSAGMYPLHWRHRYVAGGTLIIQSICLVGLANQFLSGSSTYSKLSTIWESGLLPGAGGLMTATKSRGVRD